MNKYLKILALILLVDLLCTGCSQRNEQRTSNEVLDAIKVTISDNPASDNKLVHDYVVCLTDSAGQLVDVDSVELTLTMTMRDGMRHKKSGSMERKSMGVYQLQLKWTMQGNWKENIRLKEDKNARTISGTLLE